MASDQRNVDFMLEQMAEARDVSARKMFGEYAIYCRGKLVALFCDDRLFIKPTDAGRTFLGKVKEASPYPGAKPYFLISGDQCEDGEWLSALVRVTERALPLPAPKALKKRSPKTVKTTPKIPKKARPRSNRKAAGKALPSVGKKRGSTAKKAARRS
jgi:TfoX/Sxy family transcriptional regulator of competence genes